MTILDPEAWHLVGDALDLPFPDGTFDRILTGHFYGHLPPSERVTFLAEAQRVASELIVIDSALRPAVGPEQWQERLLNDGSRHQVCKRYLTGQQLADELDGEVLLDGTWFAAARTSWSGAPDATVDSRRTIAFGTCPAAKLDVASDPIPERQHDATVGQCGWITRGRPSSGVGCRYRARGNPYIFRSRGSGRSRRPRPRSCRFGGRRDS